MKIINKKEEALCGRVVVTVEDDTSITPSNAELKKFIAGKEGVDESLVVMKRVTTSYGKSYCTAEAYVYKDIKSRDHFVETTKHMKNQAKKAKEDAEKAAEAKAAEKPAEAPAEKPAEKPEEKPAEKPTEEKPAESA